MNHRWTVRLPLHRAATPQAAAVYLPEQATEMTGPRLGGGRTVTDREGHYRFVTINPGPYPWGNRYNA